MVTEIKLIEILLGAGFLAGYVDSIAGGGGLITLPTLLAVGIPPHMALGTNKFAHTFGTFNAVRMFIKKRIVNPLLWKAAIAATFIGALLGVLLSHFISARFLNLFIPGMLFVVTLYVMFYKPDLSHQEKTPLTFKPNKKSSACVGIVLGWYDGFIGPGTGSFWAAIVMALYKLDILTASGVARFMNLVSNIVALVTFMILQDVNYLVGFCMAIGTVLGAQLGSHSAIRFGAKFIKPIFLMVVLALIGHVIVSQFITR